MIWMMSRRISTRYVVIAVTVAIAAFAFANRGMAWRSEMGRALDGAGLALFISGPILAGLAGFETWQWRRRMESFASGLPNKRALVLAPWLGVTAIGLLVQTVALALHAITALTSNAIVGSLTVWPVVTQLAGVCGYTALGALVGWYVPSPIAAPSLATGIILLNVFGVSAGLHVRELTSFGTGAREFVGMTYNPEAVALQAICMLALACAASAPRVLSDKLRGLVQAVSVSVAIVAGAVVVLTAPPRVTADQHMASSCMSERELTVCAPAAWRESDRRTLFTAVQGGVSLLTSDGVTGIPLKYQVETAESRLEKGTGLIVIEREYLNDSQAVHAAIAFAMAKADACDQPALEQQAIPASGQVLAVRSTLSAIVGRRLGVDLAGMYDPSAVMGVASLAPRDQIRWVSDSLHKVWTCDPQVSLPPGVTSMSGQSFGPS
ncbi:hypothetical protein AB0B31_28265 [Catellatospora citrea]|uniref:hypothetical protein n=1 Tax=Catellatospora citrea TaxID=53366 RepID=UPI0033C01BCD